MSMIVNRGAIRLLTKPPPPDKAQIYYKSRQGCLVVESISVERDRTYRKGWSRYRCLYLPSRKILLLSSKASARSKFIAHRGQCITAHYHNASTLPSPTSAFYPAGSRGWARDRRNSFSLRWRTSRSRVERPSCLCMVPNSAFIERRQDTPGR